MMVPFIDAETGNTIYVNPLQVAVIFEGVNAQGEQLTMINLLNGNVATKQDMISVVNSIQGELRG
jgi:hypothetical protein